MTKVFLSPSSQEHNYGAVPGYVEEVTCNMIADVIQRELNRQGSYSIMRNHPEEIYSQHRERSNAWGADLHVCIHTNANNGTARGLNAGCFNPSNPALESTKLTQAIFNQLSPLTPASDKMVKYTFDEITQTHCPCAYIEVSFHDNMDDCKWILSHIEEIGVGFAKGIVAYEGKTWVPIVITPPVVVPPVVIPPTIPPAPATGVSVGGTYKLTTLGYSGSDGTGTEVQVASVPAKCIKINSGSKYPYGMCYNGDGYIDAWFPASSIK